MKTIIDQNIFIEDRPSDQIISGYVTISATDSIIIDTIKGYVFLEARGRMSGQKMEITSFEIAKQKIITANKLYKIPFSFQLPEMRIDSYVGKNVSFSYNCEGRTYINKNDIDKIDRSIFTKLKSFVTSDKSLKVSKNFNVKSLASDYQIKELKEVFNLKFNFIILLIVAFLFGGMYAFYIPEFSETYIFLGVAFIALSTFLTNKYIENILGDVTMDTIGTEDGFICQLRKKGNFNLTNQKVFYEVIEEVVDNRGTSSSTSTEVIYTSEVQELPEFKDDASLTFYYPKTEGLFSTKWEDASIKWIMTLQGATYFGIILEYHCKLVIERKKVVA